MTQEATLNTLELGLGRPVALVDTPARRARAGCVPRVYGDKREARVGALVGEEEAQLAEGPGRENDTLLASSRDPFPDVGQLFDPNSPSGAFRTGNDLLADAVVFVTLEASFPAPSLPQEPLGSLRADGLKTAAEFEVSLPQPTDQAAGVESTVTVSGDVLYAHVDSQEVVRLGRGRGVDLDREHEAEAAA